jgi:para-nitrobenzyl esterase
VRFAERLGVTGTGTDAAKQLRAVSMDTLLAVSQGTPRFQTALVADGYALTSTVDSTLSHGGGNIVPIIVGANGDEGDAAGASSRTLARLITARGKPAYAYVFTRVGDDSANKARGAYHSAEITFVFGRPHPVLANAGTTPYDSTLADAMSDYWAAFALTGTPNGKPAAGKLPSWPTYTPSTDAYLELGPTIHAGTLPKRTIYDSLDTMARSRGDVRP